MKKIYLLLLKKLNLKSLAIIRSLISYDKKGAKRLLNNDAQEAYRDHKNYFSLLLPPDSSKTIMDFGCGTGRYLEIFNKFKFIYLVDISKQNLKLASEKANNMDIKFKILRRSFTFLGTKVDYFFSTGVFGQFYQFDSKVISKIYSLLEENGKAVFTVKIKDEFTDEVLSVSEKRVTDLLKIYNHKIHKKYFTGISGEKDYFNVIELFKKEL